MKILPYFVLVLVLVNCSAVSAQDLQLPPVKKFRVQDVFVQFGGMVVANPNGIVSDFRKLAPQSTLLTNNLAGYAQSTGYTAEIYPVFTMDMGIQFRNRQKDGYRPNPLLRVGVSYYSGRSMASDLYYSDRNRVDTLVSGLTGQLTYVDSVINHSYALEYASQQIRLNASLIYRTNPAARWSLYTGIGITAGFSLNARTDIYYDKYAYAESYEPNNNYYNPSYYFYPYDPDNSMSESFRNKSGFGFSSYIPMGIDFRIARKAEFFKRTHLFYEMKPGIDVKSIPEVRTITSTFFQFAFGLRVSWG